MAERGHRAKRRARLGGALLVISVLACCASPPAEPLVHSACGEGRCETTGNARKTTGLTADTVGIAVGPGAGQVRIRSIPQLTDRPYDVALLMRGSGFVRVTIEHASCVSSCESADIGLPAEYEWVTVASRLVQEGEITVSVETEAKSEPPSEAELLNLRFAATPSPGINCMGSGTAAR